MRDCRTTSSTPQHCARPPERHSSPADNITGYIWWHHRDRKLVSGIRLRNSGRGSVSCGGAANVGIFDVVLRKMAPRPFMGTKPVRAVRSLANRARLRSVLRHYRRRSFPVEPAVYDQTTPISPHAGRPDYHLTEDLADRAIEWLERQRASTPDRPWFCYFSTPAVHAPHHAPAEWIDRFAGKFDEGWDALRDAIYERQLELEVIPPDTANTTRPDQIPAWDDYPERYRPVATRLMECFAGFLAHTDHHIGRVIDAARALDERHGSDTLIIYLTGDNGASAEGTIHGAWSAPSFQMVFTKTLSGYWSTSMTSEPLVARTTSTLGGPGRSTHHSNG